MRLLRFLSRNSSRSEELPPSPRTTQSLSREHRCSSTSLIFPGRLGLLPLQLGESLLHTPTLPPIRERLSCLAFSSCWTPVCCLLVSSETPPMQIAARIIPVRLEVWKMMPRSSYVPSHSGRTRELYGYRAGGSARTTKADWTFQQLLNKTSPVILEDLEDLVVHLFQVVMVAVVHRTQ